MIAITRRPWAISTVVLVAGLADAITTYIALHGSQHEIGVAGGLIPAIGLVPLLALRVIVPTLLAYALLRFAKADRVIYSAAAGSVLFVTGLWTLAALSNHFGWV